MKIEKLELSNKKNKLMFFLGVILTASIFILINYLTSRANYRNTESIELAKGTINYSLSDLNVIAMYKIEDGKDVDIDTVPTEGYTLSEKSYCTIPDSETQIKDVFTFDYSTKELNIKITKKGTKCYLYFEEYNPPTAEDMLAKLQETKGGENYTITTKGTNFDGTASNGILKVTGADTEYHENTLYKAEDNDGTSYFFRGQANDNWVQFADMRWRIIRINGDGTLRMIFQCSGKDCTDTLGAKTNAISNIAYQENSGKDNTYVGYYNKGSDSISYEDAHYGSEPSTIARKVNNWYILSGLDIYEKYIDYNAGFCNDRQVIKGVQEYFDNGTGYGKSGTTYAPYGRVIINAQIRNPNVPTLKCGVNSKSANEQEIITDINSKAYERDLFTTTSASKGNKLLEYPIGLITVDEVILAGGFWSPSNTSYYLYTNESYYTMSPAFMNSNYAVVFSVYNDGRIITGNNRVTEPYNARPVINLRADITFSGGNGSIDTPFVVANN